MSTYDTENPPIAQFHPQRREVEVIEGKSEGIIQPHLDPTHVSEDNTDFEDWAIGIHEWLGLVAIRSPRVTMNDDVDTFLSQYRVPGYNNEIDAVATDLVTMK